MPHFKVCHHVDFSSWKSQPALYLYNDPKHLLLQSNSGWHVFTLQDVTSADIIARIAFHIKSGIAESPVRAPFGSIEIYGKISQHQLDGFLKGVLERLSQLTVRKVIIKNFPTIYNENHARLIHSGLSDLKFTSHQEIDSCILVGKGSFERGIKISERQKLKKSKSIFQFYQRDLHHLKRVYAFIQDCREAKGQSLSMSLLDLQKVVRAFPNRFYIFEVGNKEEIAAAAIVIHVHKEILYTFYYAHTKKYDRISPIVFLISGIYSFSKQKKIAKIDLGTSMLEGQVNRSLLHFKKSIGGVSTGKLTYSKSFK